MEWVLAPKPAGSGNRKNPLCETLPSLGLVPETEFSPLDCRADCLFGCIVCGLDSVMSKESEKMVPVIEQSLGSSAHLSIRAGQVLLTVLLHPSPHENGGMQELLAGDVAFSESMPATEDLPHFFEHVPGEYVGIRAGAPILEGFKLSNDVSPAKLPDSLLLVGTVGRMIVGGDYPVKNITQNGSEHLGASAGGYAEIHNQRGNENPKIAALPFALPSGLVDVEVSGFRKSLPCLLRNDLQLGTDTLDAVTHTSKTQIQAKEGIHDLYDTPSADLMNRTEIGCGSMDSWAKLALGYLCGKFCSGLMVTGAHQLMATILGHYGLDLRQIESLMPQRIRCLHTGSWI